MADINIGSLPAAASIEDDSLLVAEQQGEAVHFTGKQLKDYAKAGLDALVAQAQTAAEAADKAATQAEAAAKTAAEQAAAVTDDAEAAAQAAQTATEAQAAAQAAREAAENAKTAAEQAASAAAQAAADEVKATLEDYVTQAEQAKNDAQSAAGTAAEAVRATLEGYVTDAEAARDAAQAAAGTAADETAAAVRGSLQEYVDEANQAKTDAQNAAQTAADDAVAEATQQVAGYVAAAESAKEAAEKARDEAQAIVGGDFMDKSVYDPQGKARDIFAYVDEMLGSAGAQVAKATLPKGRMRGDVNGDGEVSIDDVFIIQKAITNGAAETWNEVQRWAADTNMDSKIGIIDAMQIRAFLTGNAGLLTKTPAFSDYYENWVYVKVDDTSGYFYTDIALEGVTAACSAIVAVQGDHKRDAFAGAECMDGFVRVKANLLPVADAACLVFYSPGDGTAVVLPENVIDRTGAPMELTVASATVGSTKIFGLTITDDGAMTATDGDGNAYPIGAGGGSEVVKVTMPKGRMRGDINGDGEISFDDAMMAIDPNYVPSDDVEAWCGDADQDGMVNYMDYFAITGGGFDMADYYGNWAYADGYFHTDIPVEGLTAACSAIVAVQGDHKRDAFAGAECMDGYIRIKANLLPLTDTVCLVFFSPGDGTAVVVPENVVDRVGAPTEMRLASSDGIKIFTLTITDAGVITATGNDGTAYTFTGTAVTT